MMRSGLWYSFGLVTAATAVVLWHRLNIPTRIIIGIAAKVGWVTR